MKNLFGANIGCLVMLSDWMQGTSTRGSMLDVCHKMMIYQVLVSVSSRINIPQNKQRYCLSR